MRVKLRGRVKRCQRLGRECDIEIKITCLRLGEKLYEELLIGENLQGTRHPK